jgi:putative endonuclease
MVFVYILRCADDTFYVGMTSDLQSRLQLHNAGLAVQYTASRRSVVLVHSEAFDTNAA